MIPSLLLAAVCTLQFDAPRAYDFPTMWHSEQIEVVDLDGDRNLDVVVTTEVAYIRYGSPSGRLGEAVTLPARKAIVADLDRDRQPDLVVEYDSATGPKVGVMRNLGGRRFGDPVEVYGGGATAMIAGDFTNDGAPDVLLVQEHTQPAFLLNDGRGGLDLKWGAAPALGNRKDLRTGDFNGDGHLDLAADRDPGTQLFLGNGTGYLGAGPQLGEHRYLLEVADLDRDGKDEVLTMGDLGSGVAVWRGETATELAFVKDAQALAGVAADFNGDGWADFVASTVYGPQVLLNDRTGKLVPQPGSVIAAVETFSRLASGDFDRDGKEDLAVPAGPGIAIIRGNGDGTFPTYAETAPLVASFIADVDADGLDERIVVPQPGEIVVMRGDTVAERVTEAGSERIPIFWDPIQRQLLTRTGDQVQIQTRGASGKWNERYTIRNVPEQTGVILADFTGEGVNEIAYISVVSNSLRVTVRAADNGATLFEAPLRDRAWHLLRSADMNGDALTDLVVVTLGDVPTLPHYFEPWPNGYLTIYFSTGSAFAPPVVAFDEKRPIYNAERGDFNADGADDLVISDWNGDVHVLWGSKSGVLASEVVIDSPGDFPPVTAQVADIDGDGFDDFAATQPEMPLRVFTGSAEGLVHRGSFLPPSFYLRMWIMRLAKDKPAAIVLRDELYPQQEPVFYLLQPTCAPVRRRGVRK